MECLRLGSRDNMSVVLVEYEAAKADKPGPYVTQIVCCAHTSSHPCMVQGAQGRATIRVSVLSASFVLTPDLAVVLLRVGLGSAHACVCYGSCREVVEAWRERQRKAEEEKKAAADAAAAARAGK